MTRPRIALIAVAFTLPVLLALTYLGTTTVRVWRVQADGSIKHTTTVSVSHDFLADETVDMLCGVNETSCKRWCGVCHTNGQDRSQEVYTVARHQQTYYPRAAVAYSTGQRFLSDPTGGYLTSGADGLLKYYRKDGTLEMTAPTGSLLLKDASGKTFGLYMPTAPTLRPR